MQFYTHLYNLIADHFIGGNITQKKPPSVDSLFFLQTTDDGNHYLPLTERIVLVPG